MITGGYTGLKSFASFFDPLLSQKANPHGGPGQALSLGLSQAPAVMLPSGVTHSPSMHLSSQPPPGSGPLGSTSGHSGLQVKAVGFVAVSGDDRSGGLQKRI